MNLTLLFYFTLLAFGLYLFLHGLSKEIKKGMEVKEVKYNDLVKMIMVQEGKKEEVNIAQVKEILTITLSVIANLSYTEVSQLLKKYQEFE